MSTAMAHQRAGQYGRQPHAVGQHALLLDHRVIHAPAQGAPAAYPGMAACHTAGTVVEPSGWFAGSQSRMEVAEDLI